MRALAYRRSCSRMGWVQFRAERESNSKFNGNGKFNDNCNCNCNGKFNGYGEPGGVEGAAGWGGGV